MLDFALEDVSALPAIEHPCPPLEMKLAVVRLVGGVALQHHVTEIAVMRIIQLAVLLVKWFIFLGFYSGVLLFVICHVIFVRSLLQKSNATELTEKFVLVSCLDRLTRLIFIRLTVYFGVRSFCCFFWLNLHVHCIFLCIFTLRILCFGFNNDNMIRCLCYFFCSVAIGADKIRRLRRWRRDLSRPGS